MNCKCVKPVLLAVSFGTSFNQNREETIGAVEKALQNACPEFEVRRAFTSEVIIRKLKNRDHLEIDNVAQAMERMIRDGVTDVVVQSTHMMPGIEYDEMVKTVEAYRSSFRSLKLGRPVLSAPEDFRELAQCLKQVADRYHTEETAMVWMGHGTTHEANETYRILQKALNDAGCRNHFVGTVEATPTLDDMIHQVGRTGVKSVILQPMMIVAGDHANNDMAGDDEDSWKSRFSRAGFQVRCVIEGAGQYAGLQKIIIRHAREAQ